MERIVTWWDSRAKSRKDIFEKQRAYTSDLFPACSNSLAPRGWGQSGPLGEFAGRQVLVRSGSRATHPSTPLDAPIMFEISSSRFRAPGTCSGIE